MPKRIAQYPETREDRQAKVHDFGAMLPILAVLGLQVGHCFGPFRGPGDPCDHECGAIEGISPDFHLGLTEAQIRDERQQQHQQKRIHYHSNPSVLFLGSSSSTLKFGHRMYVGLQTRSDLLQGLNNYQYFGPMLCSYNADIVCLRYGSK